ncbi:tRNA (guanine(26)-N(2))-dimethyltransferase isoform X3 [Vidua chalybeata]|uniref:tRNA (guanine(26)-N(2))-dimethyltransferase isoform X3 n=1 Tax=Vidua chalybeata TaxID=81927 RepID=UPI0023A8863F|nr:tRNA (guanine(26)-N(2))-dimethyltransferase isoform X3 [Vidua chalybeata]
MAFTSGGWRFYDPARPPASRDGRNMAAPIRPPVPPTMDGASPNGLATPPGSVATPEGSAGPPQSEGAPPGSGETLITEGRATIVFPSANEVFYNPVQGFNRDLTCAVLTEFARLQLRPKGIRVVLPGEEELGGSPQSPPEAGDPPTAPETPRTARPGEACEDVDVPKQSSAGTVRRHRPGPLREPHAFPGRGRAGRERGGAAVRDVHGHGGDGRQQRRDLLQQIRRRVPQGQVLPRDGPADRPAQPRPPCQLLPALRGAAAVGQRRLLRARLRQGLHGPGQGQGLGQQAGAGVPLHGVWYTPPAAPGQGHEPRQRLQVQRSHGAARGSHLRVLPAAPPGACNPPHPPHTSAHPNEALNPLFSPLLKVGGPVWAEPLHDPTFVEGVLAALERSPGRFSTEPRMRGMLSVIAEELSDVPLYYTLDGLSSTIRSNTPSLLQLRSALLHAGFRVSLSHACRNAVKTDAPPAVLWDIMRCWAKLHPVKRERLPDSSPAARILSVEPTLQASFALHEDANPSSRKRGLKRFPENPEAFWGPKARAKPGGGTAPSLQEKRERLQNKRTQQPDGARLKQFPCKRFKEGTCPQGEQCCYSHEPTSAAPH